MDDQLKDQVSNGAAEGDGEATRERVRTGIKPLDEAVSKIDAGVRRISSEIHKPLEVEEDPNRVATGIKPLDQAVYKIDAGVRRISSQLHKDTGSSKKD